MPGSDSRKQLRSVTHDSEQWVDKYYRITFNCDILVVLSLLLT